MDYRAKRAEISNVIKESFVKLFDSHRIVHVAMIGNPKDYGSRFVFHAENPDLPLEPFYTASGFQEEGAAEIVCVCQSCGNGIFYLTTGKTFKGEG